MRELKMLLESMIDDPEMTVEKATAKAKTGLALLNHIKQSIQKEFDDDGLHSYEQLDHIKMILSK